MIVPGCLIPVANRVPVELERSVVVDSTLKRILDARDSQELVEPVCIEVIYDRLVRYLVLSKLPYRASFQPTFYGVAKEVISSCPSVRVHQNKGVREARFG